MVWGTRVSADGGTVVMGMAEITTLHALWKGKLELSPSLEDESSSQGDSSRMACSDGDPVWVMPQTTSTESSPLRRWTEVVGVLGSELKVFKVDGLVLGELYAK
jgi:hypothetical protein